jgi:hypothetical protein
MKKNKKHCGNHESDNCVYDFPSDGCTEACIYYWDNDDATPTKKISGALRRIRKERSK